MLLQISKTSIHRVDTRNLSGHPSVFANCHHDLKSPSLLLYTKSLLISYALAANVVISHL